MLASSPAYALCQGLPALSAPPSVTLPPTVALQESRPVAELCALRESQAAAGAARRRHARRRRAARGHAPGAHQGLGLAESAWVWAQVCQKVPREGCRGPSKKTLPSAVPCSACSAGVVWGDFQFQLTPRAFETPAPGAGAGGSEMPGDIGKAEACSEACSEACRFFVACLCLPHGPVGRRKWWQASRGPARASSRHLSTSHVGE